MMPWPLPWQRLVEPREGFDKKAHFCYSGLTLFNPDERPVMLAFA